MPTTPKPKVVKIQYEDLPRAAHQQPPLRSSVADRVAIRLDGITYLLAPGQVEGFRARHTHEDHQQPDGLNKTSAL